MQQQPVQQPKPQPVQQQPVQPPIQQQAATLDKNFVSYFEAYFK